ncbi:unnamed protein product [Pseudo-nitzschia multistriata]|uniref:GH16 domain-containing protein n=1 Tax=Pseudo-nitzschia multistriata TaxID=183589 RepID=A0A448Z026_9STRA|nr:unnamed protein product [Pseudo-nitzschia multistriata]
MAPRESDSLLPYDDDNKKPALVGHLSIASRGCNGPEDPARGEDTEQAKQLPAWFGTAKSLLLVPGTLLFVLVLAGSFGSPGADHGLRSGIHTLAEALANKTAPSSDENADGSYTLHQGTGPYALVERHTGKSFFDHYDFADGPDSIGSAGYNTYVGRHRAGELGLARVVQGGNDSGSDSDEYVVLSSRSGTTFDENGNRYRESVRLEGKRRIDHGLILLDVEKMPTGCGVWPAFWSTDEAHWPDYGEIDIVEPINNQVVAKTALHTSEGCDMFAHVPRWNWTGHWDSATGLPDTFTGEPNFDTEVQADNCWTMTPHQWANQGCVAIHDKNGTIGEPMNQNGGGVYALEWDPTSGYIRSWVFRRGEIPRNLQQALAGSGNPRPDPSSWPTPYAYFAIGEGSGCPSEHFRHHRLVINLAFCGAVAGNRFARDCPALYERYNVRNDSVATCNAYLESDEARALLDEEAYWKIGGVHLYQREHA